MPCKILSVLISSQLSEMNKKLILYYSGVGFIADILCHLCLYYVTIFLSDISHFLLGFIDLFKTELEAHEMN